MSEWFYIRLAYGLTWAVLLVYALLLHRRRLRAEASRPAATAAGDA